MARPDLSKARAGPGPGRKPGQMRPKSHLARPWLCQGLTSHIGQVAVPGTTLLLCSALVRQCKVNGVAQRQNEWWNAVVGMVSCSSKSVVDDYPLIKKRTKMAMVVSFKPEPGQTSQKPGPGPQ